MDEKARKSYNDVEAVDILHQVSNFYISTKVPHDYGSLYFGRGTYVKAYC